MKESQTIQNSMKVAGAVHLEIIDLSPKLRYKNLLYLLVALNPETSVICKFIR